jgi:methylase of polypeptide subunit release factors
MQYFGMYNWTKDVPENSKEYFLEALKHLSYIEKPKVLEIGTFTGTSIATIKNLYPNAECFAVDNWVCSC